MIEYSRSEGYKREETALRMAERYRVVSKVGAVLLANE
jgi:hypothetical protein